MANGAVITVSGFNTVISRAFEVSPVATAPSRFKIGTGTDTPATTDTDMTTAITVWNAGSDYKDFVSGYPTFDTVNQKVTTQCFIGATQANGNTITECGDFNTDAVPACISHIVFTGITKVSTVQVFITNSYKRGD